MKHSTSSPTKAEAARMDAIKAGVCIACDQRGIVSRFPDVHHLLSGNRRRGHTATIGLCPWHHRGYVSQPGWHARMRADFGPSLAEGSKPFHAAFGSDDELLALQDQMIWVEA